MEIQVAEVKSFPKVDERVDPDKLGLALDQVAIYILLTRDEVLHLGGDPERLVSDLALLITPRNVGLSPVLSQQRVSARLTRTRRLLDSIPLAQDVAASVPAGLSFGPVADEKASEQQRLDALHNIADHVGTAYQPSCLCSCGNARFCRQRAIQSGAPCITGITSLRLLPGVPTLDRAEQLTRGETPTSEEAPVASVLEQAGRLYDATINDPPPARRLA
jgi:hypothetical protein